MEQSKYNGTHEKQKKQTVVYAIAGGITIAAILLVTMIWVSGSARVGTDEAVNRVSQFYLEELAGRRQQVVSQELKNHFSYMEKAIETLKKTDLESQEALREFLGTLKNLYQVEKFALVDENGIVYTENSTTSGLSRYSFLSGDSLRGKEAGYSCCSCKRYCVSGLTN